MFLFKLALRLGITVNSLLDTMSSNELLLWQEFDRISPIGDERADAAAGMIAAVIVNDLKRDPRKRPEPFTAKDFMLFREKSESEQKFALAKKARAALFNTGR